MKILYGVVPHYEHDDTPLFSTKEAAEACLRLIDSRSYSVVEHQMDPSLESLFTTMVAISEQGSIKKIERLYQCYFDLSPRIDIYNNLRVWTPGFDEDLAIAAARKARDERIAAGDSWNHATILNEANTRLAQR